MDTKNTIKFQIIDWYAVDLEPNFSDDESDSSEDAQLIIISGLS